MNDAVINNSIEFKVGEIKKDTSDCKPEVMQFVNDLEIKIKDMEYAGKIRWGVNSNQLDINFDENYFRVIKSPGWECEINPQINMIPLNENWGNQKADAIIKRNKEDENSVVIEIEKANKKTLWFDFIKLWMFIEAKQASFGILVCPLNYVFKNGTWDLFKETCDIKKYLGRFAKVPLEKLNLIGILGFTQFIKVNGIFKKWDEKEYNRVKRRD